ncbi:HPr family phosphocarrier protein [Robertmurraya sp. P23]|uniref:HPr family phosphocarrier protein n=1 Tax=Robertmurraya sp. P23 TaxID=3436931 RepID=UPI003D959ACF
MLRTKIVVQLNRGLRARSASEFVRIATLFTSDINIIKKGRLLDGKSIMGLMCQSIREGEEIILIADGIDEIEASHCLSQYLLNNK